MKRFFVGLVLGIVLTILVMLGILYYQKKEPVIIPPTKTITKTDTVYIEKKITIYKTIKESTIDTIYVDNEVKDIVASTTFEINQDDIKGDLSVEFAYFSQMFSLKSTNLVYAGEIVTNETVKTEYIPLPIPKFKGLLSAGIWQSNNKYDISLGMGIRLYNKIDILINANTQKEIGIIANWRI